MPFRIAHVPLVVKDHVVSPAGIDITLRSFQPVAWVRLVPWVGHAETDGVFFPAVVDTGNNHSFLIPGPFFRAWAKTDYRTLPKGRELLVNGIPLHCYGFNLELSRLREHKPTGQVAARLQTGEGVMIIPDSLVPQFPRLPVLGVRCLTANRVTFAVNGDMRTFSLSQPRIPRGK